MRGKDGTAWVYGDALGITPAYAGKSIQAGYSGRRTRDHPRLCGEKPRGWDFWLTYGGSPPPMRGKVAILSPSTDHGGITPAYAGKSQNRKIAT